jgi:hypothetical protein
MVLLKSGEHEKEKKKERLEIFISYFIRGHLI